MGDVVVDSWNEGNAYESYVGRWSRPVAHEFLAWLNVGPRKKWLDVGCGTGVLSYTILQNAEPAEVLGIDRSADYIEFAKRRVDHPLVRFDTGSAESLPIDDNMFDATVSGLMLNFVPQPERAVAEMVRCTRGGGTVAVYVWDYAHGMQMIRYFWDAARWLTPEATALDEAARFPICEPEALSLLFAEATLADVQTNGIDVVTSFETFDDFWLPFTGGQGPAPAFLNTLTIADRARLRERIRHVLPLETDGSIELTARAWAVRGVKGEQLQSAP